MLDRPERIKFFMFIQLPMILITLITILACLYGRYFYFYCESFKRIFISETNVIENLHSTITPSMDTKIETGENLIYCATLPLMLNELNKLVKETLEIENTPWYVKKFKEFNIKDLYIPEESYIVLAETGKYDVTKKITKIMEDKFNKSINLNSVLDKDEMMAFSHMSNEVNFGLTRFSETDLFCFKNNLKRVKYMGLSKFCNENYVDLRKKIKIFHYKSYDCLNHEFTIKLLPQNSSDEVIISTIFKEDTLYNTYKKILSQIDTREIYSQRDIYFSMPMIDFFMAQNYSDFKNIKILNKLFSSYRISEIIQSISFQFKEKDKLFELKNKIFYDQKGIRLIAYRPFFICIKNKNSKLPYFMIYIANKELFVKD